MSVSAPSLPDSGVHFTVALVHELRKVAEKQALSWQEIDLSAVHDKPGLMAAFSRGLRLPSGFGGNWDALADALHDLVASRGVCLYLSAAGGYAERRPDDFRLLCSILGDVASEWQGRGRRYLVLLAGIKPDGHAAKS